MSRKPNELRNVTIERSSLTRAPGSVLVAFGETRVLCTASLTTDLPGWMKNQAEPKGWVTAEYNMLPASTSPRKSRKTDGRSTEIQRLIGRVLRSAVDLSKMPGLMIQIDCEVLSADGGTRTAAITGGFVALRDAIEKALGDKLIDANPLINMVAAVSVGIVDDQAYLDLDYDLDYRAAVDLNVAMTEDGEFIEIQGTGEESSYSRQKLNAMLDLAESGIAALIEKQKLLF